MSRKMVCKVPKGEVFVKIMEEEVQAGLETGARLFFGGSGPVSCDGQGKAHRKWANGYAGKLFRTDSRIIQVY